MPTHITPSQTRRKGVFCLALGLLSLLLFGSFPAPLFARVELEAPTYRDRGYHAQQKGQLALAFEYYQKAIALDPFYATPHNDLGILYEKQEKLEQAEEEYLKAIAIDPRFLDPYANLALLYERLERREESLKHWKIRAEKGDPGDFWTQKAWTRLGTGQIKKSP